MSRCSITYIESISAFFLRIPIDEGDVHGELSVRIDDLDSYDLYAWVTEHGMDPVSRLLSALVDSGVEFEHLAEVPFSGSSRRD